MSTESSQKFRKPRFAICSTDDIVLRIFSQTQLTLSVRKGSTVGDGCGRERGRATDGTYGSHGRTFLERAARRVAIVAYPSRIVREGCQH